MDIGIKDIVSIVGGNFFGSKDSSGENTDRFEIADFYSDLSRNEKYYQKIKDTVKKQIADSNQVQQKQPCLATILVGENPASQVYIRHKIKACEYCHVKSLHIDLPASSSEDDLLTKIQELNANENVNGILVQLPLPKHFNEEKILNAICPKKDVDGFHPVNFGNLVIGNDSLKPCTPHGVMQILEHYQIELSGKDVVVVGRSNIVGKPQAIMMLEKNATVTIVHSKTQNLKAKLKAADIVVVAIGKPKVFDKTNFKDGAVIVDVGINRLESGKLCGDVDYESASEVASYITPVPGGVGPMTIAMLIQNTWKAFCQQNEI